MKNIRILRFVASISFLCLPVIIFAQWSTNPAVNNQICGLSGEQAIPKIATCANGDTYIGYFSNESGNYDVRLQRLDAQGNILWASDGILISANPQNTWLTDWDMTCDNDNHCILAFNDIRSSGNTNVVAYRISPSGTFIWGDNGILLSNTTAFNAAPKVVATTAGNIIVAWQADNVIIMQKITPAGSLLWGTAGITLTSPNRLSWPQLLPVGTDEVIMKYFDDSGPINAPTRHVFAQRYNASGVAVWSSPAAISLAGGISAWTQIFPFINDGSDGFYICWNDDRDNNMRSSVFVQHVNSSGVVQFTTNGVEVTNASTMNHYYPEMALPPGSTDVYVFWNEMNGNQDNWGIDGQKINSAGALQWGASGMIFIPLSTTNVYPYEARNSPTDVVLFYEEYTNAINGLIKAMRIAPDGAFLWTPAQKTMCSVVSQKVHPVVNEFGNNQWIASWEDNRNGNSDIYAQNIQLNGDLGPYNSTYGTISGTVTLNGGSGNVTQVVVQAGTNITNPDALGHYSMVVLTGTYTVTASLSGYTTGSQSNVVVLTNLVTTVNFMLNHIPEGTIQGTVTLVNGTGSITMVVIHAGFQTTNPDGTGHYSLQVSPGTYNVIATLTAYIPDTVYSVTVADGQTVSNIDLSLTLAPTNGFITGTVTLNGGTGNVTQTVVYAGGFTANPNSSGFYTLDVPAGFYDVSATLTGYLQQMVIGVQVIVGQTTPNINFFLDPEGSAGTIQGHVTITGGNANVTQADVTAGAYSTHPDVSGDYSLTVPTGTYSVTATHPYTTTETIPNVVVTSGVNTTGINFSLAIDRADMVCSATRPGTGFLNNVDVIIQGPEGPYTGTILNDSLVFPHVPYGVYHGTAIYSQWAPVTSDTTINAANHDMIFNFSLEVIFSKQGNHNLQVNPTPSGPGSMISFSIPAGGLYSFDLLDARGSWVGGMTKEYFSAGNHQIPLSSNSGNNKMVQGFYLLKLSGENGFIRICKVVYSVR
jgi:hypothetical protein